MAAVSNLEALEAKAAVAFARGGNPAGDDEA